MTESTATDMPRDANPLTDLPDVAGEFCKSALEGYIAGRESVLLEDQERTLGRTELAFGRQQEELDQLVPGE